MSVLKYFGTRDLQSFVIRFDFEVILNSIVVNC